MATPFSTSTCFTVTPSGSCVRMPLRCSAAVGPSSRRASAASIPLPRRLASAACSPRRKETETLIESTRSFAGFVPSQRVAEAGDGAVLHERVDGAVQRAEQLAALLDRDAVALARGDDACERPVAVGRGLLLGGEDRRVVDRGVAAAGAQLVEERGRRLQRAAASSPA